MRLSGHDHPSGNALRTQSSSRPRAHQPVRAVQTSFAGQTRPPTRFDLNRSLITALLQQARDKALPQVEELVSPLLRPPPAPLTDTLDPRALADPDSRFTTVDGVLLHYKDFVVAPGPPPQPPGRSAAARGGGGGGGAAGAAAQAPQPEEPLTLLFLHGFNGSTFNFRRSMPDIAAALGTRRAVRVIAFDRPPFGLSGRPLSWEGGEDASSPYTQAAGARFAAGLLAQLGVSRAVVCGHSAGAGVAVQLAQTHPGLVTALVLVAPALAVDEGGFLRRLDLGQLARLLWTRALLSTDGPGLHYVRDQIYKRRDAVINRDFGVRSDEAALDDATVEGYLRPLRAHDWDKASLLMYRSFALQGSVPDYDALGMPVLVVQGDQDDAVPQSLALRIVDRLRARPRSSGGSVGAATTPAAAASPDGSADGAGRAQGQPPVTEYVELAATGHIPMEERPEQFAAAVVGFVEGSLLDGPAGRPATRRPPSPSQRYRQAVTAATR